MSQSTDSEKRIDPAFSTNEYGLQINRITPTVPGIKLPASAGWLWYKQAWNNFTRQPGYWYLSMIIMIIYVIVISLMSFVGSIFGALLGPIIVVGFLTFARRIDVTNKADISDLFTGFKLNLKNLLLLGLIQIAVAISIVGVCGLLYVLTVSKTATTKVVKYPATASSSATSDVSTSAASTSTDAASSATDTAMNTIYEAFTTFDPSSGLWILVLGTLIYMLFSTAMLYAPGLISFKGLKPFEALRYSFKAVWINWGCHLVFALILFLFSAFLGGFAALMSTSGLSMKVIAAIMAFLVIIVALLWPMYYAAYYSAFKDIFKWSIEIPSEKNVN